MPWCIPRTRDMAKLSVSLPCQRLKQGVTLKAVEQSSQGQGTWVDAGLRVEFPVAVDLCTAHQDGLNPDQLADGEGQVEVQVAGSVQLHLSSIHPAGTARLVSYNRPCQPSASRGLSGEAGQVRIKAADKREEALRHAWSCLHGGSVEGAG